MLALPPPFLPHYSHLPFSGITWVEAEPWLQDKAADDAILAGTTHLQPWPKELRPEAQVAPGTLPEGWREGKGWSLRLDPPADTGSAGRAWHWAGDPPRLPLLGCAVSAEQWSASKFAETRGGIHRTLSAFRCAARDFPKKLCFNKRRKRYPGWVDRFVRRSSRPWSSALASGGSSPRWVSFLVCLTGNSDWL